MRMRPRMRPLTKNDIPYAIKARVCLLYKERCNGDITTNEAIAATHELLSPYGLQIRIWRHMAQRAPHYWDYLGRCVRNGDKSAIEAVKKAGLMKEEAQAQISARGVITRLYSRIVNWCSGA